MWVTVQYCEYEDSDGWLRQSSKKFFLQIFTFMGTFQTSYLLPALDLDASIESTHVKICAVLSEGKRTKLHLQLTINIMMTERKVIVACTIYLSGTQSRAPA